MVYKKVRTGMYWVFDSSSKINPSYLAMKFGNKHWRIFSFTTEQVLNRKIKTLRDVKKILYARRWENDWCKVEELPEYIAAKEKINERKEKAIAKE